jgi:MFS family permease
MTEAAISLRGPSVAMNPWLVAAAVVVPTFMEVLDTTISVVALRYIAGGLSATVDDGEWVITSYLAANAIILPITGWLTTRFGRRNYFLVSILVFTLSSGLCGMATSLNQLILFRVIQGLAGGRLQPCTRECCLTPSRPRSKAQQCRCLVWLPLSRRSSVRLWVAGLRRTNRGVGSSTSTSQSVSSPRLPAMSWSMTRTISRRSVRSREGKRPVLTRTQAIVTFLGHMAGSAWVVEYQLPRPGARARRFLGHGRGRQQNQVEE